MSGEKHTFPPSSFQEWKYTHTHTKLSIFAGRLCRPKEMARVKFQTKSPRRILSGNVGRLCVALWKSEYESQDEGGRMEDKIMMLNHVQGDLGRLEIFKSARTSCTTPETL